MKKYKLFITVLIFPVLGFAQNKNIAIYKNVYNYLIKNGLNNYSNVGVSNEIIFIEYSSFINKKGKMSSIDSLNLLDDKIQFKPYFIYGLSKKIRAKKSFHNIIYFSKPYNDYLIVDFISSKKQIRGNYKAITMFGTVRRYLFKIEQNNVLKIANVEISNN